MVVRSVGGVGVWRGWMARLTPARPSQLLQCPRSAEAHGQAHASSVELPRKQIINHRYATCTVASSTPTTPVSTALSVGCVRVAALPLYLPSRTLTHSATTPEKLPLSAQRWGEEEDGCGLGEDHDLEPGASHRRSTTSGASHGRGTISGASRGRGTISGASRGSGPTWKESVGEIVLAEVEAALGVSQVEAQRVVQHQEFLKVSDTAITKTLHLLLNRGIPAEQILRYPAVLLCSVEDYLEKLPLLTEPHMFDTISDGLGFCQFKVPLIQYYQCFFSKEASALLHHKNRIYYMAHQLQVGVAELTEKVVGPQFILTKDLQRINDYIDLLKAYGVRSEDVVSDLWVMTHNLEQSERRLREAMQAGITHIKPWICRAAPSAYDKYIKMQMDKVTAKAERVGYLVRQLGCSPGEVEHVASLHRGLLSLPQHHLQQKINYLMAHGFTTQDIGRELQVLLCSDVRVKTRVRQLKKAGWFPAPLHLLLLPTTTFRAALGRHTRGEEEGIWMGGKSL